MLNMAEEHQVIETKTEENGAFSPQDKPNYSKEAIVQDGSWSLSDRAILKIVLVDDQKYSLTDSKNKINEFKGGI